MEAAAAQNATRRGGSSATDVDGRPRGKRGGCAHSTEGQRMWRERGGGGCGGVTVLYRHVEVGDGRRGGTTRQMRAKRERERGVSHPDQPAADAAWRGHAAWPV
jgi:hypothetical protein